MRDGVNPEVQLAPPPARPNAVFLIKPFSLAVNLQTCAIDKKMQWLRTIEPLEQDRDKAIATRRDAEERLREVMAVEEARRPSGGSVRVKWGRKARRAGATDRRPDRPSEVSNIVQPDDAEPVTQTRRCGRPPKASQPEGRLVEWWKPNWRDDFARDLFCSGDGHGLALQRIAREISPGPLAQSHAHDQPGEIDATCDAVRNARRVCLPGGRVDFVCSALRRCALDFGWSSSPVATISHARCQNSTSRPGGRPLASHR
jgi:hypothetical protein